MSIRVRHQKGYFEPLDRIIALLESEGIRSSVWTSRAPGHPVQTQEWRFKFEGDSFEIYRGNYFGHEPGQGAVVVGAGAFE